MVTIFNIARKIEHAYRKLTARHSKDLCVCFPRLCTTLVTLPTVNENEINHLIITIHHHPRWKQCAQAGSLIRRGGTQGQDKWNTDSARPAAAASTVAGGSVTNWPDTTPPRKLCREIVVRSEKLRAKIHCTCHATQPVTSP